MMTPEECYALGRGEEREDVLTFLTRRHAACETMERRSPDEADRAAVMKRQLSVLIDEIRTGMHEGDRTVSPILTQSED